VIIGACCLAERTVGRRAPKVVRREETICRTHDRAVHHVRGVSPVGFQNGHRLLACGFASGEGRMPGRIAGS